MMEPLMTVDAQSVVEGPFAPNGATTAWPFTFTADDASEVSLVRVSPQGGAIEVDGEVVLDPGGGGAVTVEPPLAAGSGELYVLLVPSFAQTTAFEAQGAFSPTAMNRALDRAAARDQYLKAVLDRAVLAPLGGEGLDAGAIVAGVEAARDTALAEVAAAVQANIQANLNLAGPTLDWIAACAAAGSAPSIGRAMLIDEVVRRLIAVDAFSWCAGVFVVGESKAQTLVNLADPGVPAVEEGGALPFLADRWLQGASPACLDTNVALPGRFAQDSAFMLARQVSDTQVSGNRMIGARNGKAWLTPGTGGASPNFHVRALANAAEPFDSSSFITNGVGTYGWIRRAPDAWQLMFGQDVAEQVAAGAGVTDGQAQSTAIAGVGNEILLLCAGAQYATGKGLYWAFGAAPTDAQYSGLVAALEFYGHEIGALP
jgi:hypothetical protein